MLKKLTDRFLLSWRVRTVPKRGMYTCRRFGLTFKLHVERYVDREIAVGGIFEASTTTQFLRVLGPGCRFLDVGANLGWYSLLAARVVGTHGQVIACEPTALFRADLCRHLQVNGLEERIRVLPLALSDRSGEVSISINEHSATMNATANAGDPVGVETIQARTLDELHSAGDIPAVDLIKIDVDGHEPAILRGAVDYLGRYHPVIIIEMAQWCLEAGGSSAEGLREQLNGLGYTLFSEHTKRTFPSRLAFMAECANWDHSVNVWAVPTELAKQMTTLDELRLPHGDR